MEMAKRPTFHFWDTVLQAEVSILILSRAHRERNFVLYADILESLMFLFFAIDHNHYRRWLSVHLRDMKPLPKSIKQDFHKKWVVQKTSHHLSSLEIDQIHEQKNLKAKGTKWFNWKPSSGQMVEHIWIWGKLNSWLSLKPDTYQMLTHR